MEKNDIDNKITENRNLVLSCINKSLFKMKHLNFSPLIGELDLIQEKHPPYSVQLDTMKTQLQEIAHLTDEKTSNPPNIFEGIDDLHVLEEILNCMKTFIFNVNLENL